MDSEATPLTAKRPRRYLVMMAVGLFLLVLSAGSITLTLLGIAADWIGWLGFFLAPVATTVLLLGFAGPVDSSIPPPHPLQVLNNCQ